MASHWLIVSNGGTSLYHTLRNDNGRWQSTWNDVFAALHGAPDTGIIKASTFRADSQNNLHVCLLTSQNNLWHAMRAADGHWQSNWGDVMSRSSGLSVASVTALASAANDAGSFEICAVTTSGIYHTVRHSDATWQQTWRNLNTAVTNQPLVGLFAGG